VEQLGTSDDGDNDIGADGDWVLATIATTTSARMDWVLATMAK
jgi:hypothetical protein